jgi:endoglycosylceramidase
MKSVFLASVFGLASLAIGLQARVDPDAK